MDSSQDKNRKGKKLVILDTDPGVDDMQAVFIALADKDVEVIALTTVLGDGDSELMLKNTQRILAYINRTDIPVYQGSKFNLSGEIPQSDGYFGKDAMGDIDLAYPENYKEQKMSSHEALIYYINKYPNEITLLCIGPMVNLALAFLNDNDIFKKLKEIYMMGCDKSEKTLFNVTEWAEFNAWCDPVSMNVVLKNFNHPSKLLHIIDFDFCRKHEVPMVALNEYYDADSSKLNKMGELAQKSYRHMKTKFKESGLIVSDQYAVYSALYADEAKIVGYRAAIKSVSFEGEKKGHTEFEKSENGNLFIIEDLNMAHFLSVLIKSVQN